MKTRGVVLLLALCAGCATNDQPAFRQASIVPDTLVPDQTALVTIDVHDRFGTVAEVRGVVAEDRTIVFDLKDDGVPPDAKAGDGIWTIEVKAPFNAPPGTFVFEATAYDSDGAVVVIDDENNEAIPMRVTIPVNIVFPDTGPAEE